MLGLSGLFMFSGKIERVEFNKVTRRLHLEKYKLCQRHLQKPASVRLRDVVEVYAARKGNITYNSDHSYFSLVLTLKSGTQLKILQTKNPQRIKKEVSDSYLKL